MANVQPAEEFQRVLQSLVRVGLSLGGHIGAFGTFIWLGDETPLWLPALFALVITWYFATNEWTGQRPNPAWQLKLRSLVRALHAIGGGTGLALVFIYAPEGAVIPEWWVAIYTAILTFYFIEMRDPPKAVSTSSLDPR